MERQKYFGDVMFRLHKGGLLKSLPVFKDLNMKDLMPLNVSFQQQKKCLPHLYPGNQLEEPDEGCLRPHKDVFCFLAGDVRNNENMVRQLL